MVVNIHSKKMWFALLVPALALSGCRSSQDNEVSFSNSTEGTAPKVSIILRGNRYEQVGSCDGVSRFRNSGAVEFESNQIVLNSYLEWKSCLDSSQVEQFDRATFLHEKGVFGECLILGDSPSEQFCN